MCFTVCTDKKVKERVKKIRYGYKVVRVSRGKHQFSNLITHQGRASYDIGKRTMCDDPHRRFIMDGLDGFDKSSNRGIYVYLNKSRAFAEVLSGDDRVVIRVRLKGFRCTNKGSMWGAKTGTLATYDSVVPVSVVKKK